VPLYDRRLGPVAGLVLADRADPGMIAEDGPAERQNFTVVAALVRTVSVERPAVLLFVFGDRQLGLHQLHLDAVALLDALADLQRFLELIAGVEVEDPHPRLDLREHVDDAVP